MIIVSGRHKNRVKVVHYLPKWIRLTNRMLFSAHRNVRKATRRILLNKIKTSLSLVLKGGSKGIPYPKTLQIINSVACEANCKQCLFQSYTDRKQELSLADLQRLFRESQDLNVATVHLIGADVFYRSDALRFLELLKQQTVQLFLLFTDGLRITPQHIELIRDAGNILLVLNIDGGAKTNDWRKGAGAFQKIEVLCERLKQENLVFGTSTMVSNANLDEVTRPSFIKQIRDLGAVFTAYLPFSPVTDRDSELEITADAYARLFPKSLELNGLFKDFMVYDLLGFEENVTSCSAAESVLCVFNDGTVSPCFAIPAGFKGSTIHQKSLKEIWVDDPLFKAVRTWRQQETDQKLRCLFMNPDRLRGFVRQHETDEFSFLSSMAAKRYRSESRQ